MYVKEIRWIYKSIYEAEFIVSDGRNDVLCFAQPFFLQVGDTVNELHSIDAQDIVRSEHHPEVVSKGDELILCGQLTSRSRRSVKIGQLFVTIDDDIIPKDIAEGEYIRFTTSRLRFF